MLQSTNTLSLSAGRTVLKTYRFVKKLEAFSRIVTTFIDQETVSNFIMTLFRTSCLTLANYQMWWKSAKFKEMSKQIFLSEAEVTVTDLRVTVKCFVKCCYPFSVLCLNFSVYKTNICTSNIHSNKVFVYCYTFRRNSTIFREFIHQHLKLTKV